MEYWYKNTIAITSILLLAIILEYLKKSRTKNMFEVNDIKNDLTSLGSVLLMIAHPDDEINKVLDTNHKCFNF